MKKKNVNKLNLYMCENEAVRDILKLFTVHAPAPCYDGVLVPHKKKKKLRLRD